MQHRWTSRKFLLTLSAQVVGALVLLWPAHEQAIVEVGRCVTSLLVIGLTSAGYVRAEAALDASKGGAVESPGGAS